MDRVAWGPGPSDRRVVCGVVLPAMPLSAFLERVRRLREAAGVPVQVLRADRVVSVTHVEVAAWHVALSRAGGRARSDDLAVDFLLYVAGDRQIKRAIRDFGYDHATGGACLVVALADVDAARFRAAVAEAFDVEVTPWGDDEPDEGADDATVGAARAFWALRLGLDPAASPRDVEDAVLAAMADLAVARL